jgi:hypothetical protein
VQKLLQQKSQEKSVRNVSGKVTDLFQNAEDFTVCIRAVRQIRTEVINNRHGSQQNYGITQRRKETGQETTNH